MTFPADFVWGAATAAHQVEGGNWNSDCWALESAKPSFFVEHSGVACDQFARYGDDLAILAGLGESDWRTPSNVLQQRWALNRMMHPNVQLSFTLYRGRTLDPTLAGAVLAPGLTLGRREPWVNRAYADITYRY